LFRGEKVDVVTDLMTVKQPAEAALQELRSMFPDKPVVISEFGCEGILGLHGDQYWSEEYQVEFVKTHAEMLIAQPNVQGIVYWAYADYPGHRGYCNDVSTVGYYGVVTRKRQVKPVAEVLKGIYNRWSL
jgi:hypothetical protein